MNADNKRYAPLAFWLGLTALLVAGGVYFVYREPNTAFYVTLALGVIGLAAWAYLDPQRARAAFSGRQARYGGNAALLVLGFLGIFVVFNWLISQNEQRWDLSEDSTNTLSAETLALLAELDEPVAITAYYTAQAEASADNVRKLLENYAFSTDGLISYEFVDPTNDPVGAAAYSITQDRTLVLVRGDRHEIVTVASEQELSAALLRLGSQSLQVYFLTGHNEFNPDATSDPTYRQAATELTSRGYLVATLNLLVEGAIPEDAALIVIAGPLVPLSNKEISLLEDYVAAGGDMVILLEPTILTSATTAEDPLARYLAQDWGLVLGDDVVVDRQTQSNFQAVAAAYAQHPITDKMSNVVTIYPTARSVQLAEVLPEGVTAQELILTAPFDTSWAETDMEALRAQQPITPDEDQDIPGPVAIAVAAENLTTGARLAVFGDADFGSDQFYSVQLNGKMFLNAVDWAAEQEALINVSAPQPTARFVLPPFPQYTYLVILMAVIVLPGIFVVSGLVVFFQRRRRG
ncbi:MAG: GldG family protein [Chloroflexi bacterium]|nr:GldG family protein [Chloroflexota bacterium]